MRRKKRKNRIPSDVAQCLKMAEEANQFAVVAELEQSTGMYRYWRYGLIYTDLQADCPKCGGNNTSVFEIESGLQNEGKNVVQCFCCNIESVID